MLFVAWIEVTEHQKYCVFQKEGSITVHEHINGKKIFKGVKNYDQERFSAFVEKLPIEKERLPESIQKLLI